MSIKYKNYTISHDPKPIPLRSFDWDFSHDDYDGAPDGNDIRCGNGANIEDCKQQIDDMENEND